MPSRCKHLKHKRSANDARGGVVSSTLYAEGVCECFRGERETEGGEEGMEATTISGKKFLLDCAFEDMRGFVEE